jgi:hypothetical protein
MIPTEEEEQRHLVQYLKIRKIPHFRVPNETYIKGWKQKAKNKALGVQPGVPDLFVYVHNQWQGFEMKRIKGGVLSDHQKHWINLLNNTGVPTHVFKGASAAIDFIEKRVPEVQLPARKG